jgi:Ca2+-binding RTX toxin-like protein
MKTLIHQKETTMIFNRAVKNSENFVETAREGMIRSRFSNNQFSFDRPNEERFPQLREIILEESEGIIGTLLTNQFSFDLLDEPRFPQLRETSVTSVEKLNDYSDRIISRLEDFDLESVESFSSTRSYDPENGYEGTGTITIDGTTYDLDYADGSLTISGGEINRTISLEPEGEFPLNETVTREFTVTSNYDSENGYRLTRNRDVQGENGGNATGELTVETDGEGNVNYTATGELTTPEAETIEVGLEGIGSYDPEQGYDGTTTISINDQEVTMSKGEGVIETSFSDVNVRSGRLGKDNFSIRAETNEDLIRGEASPRIFFSGNGEDSIDLRDSLVSNHRVYGGSEDDDLFANWRSRLFGGAGNDTLDSSEGLGKNRLYGGEGDDTLILGRRDRAVAGDGSDQIIATKGGNTLSGNGGEDQFWLMNGEMPNIANRITDFTSGEDVIGFAGVDFSFEDLSINQLGETNGTRLTVEDQGVGILLGVNPTDLTEADFNFSADVIVA